MIYKLENTVQHYAWGSPVLIPEFLGRENPQGKPWAELWMGAHPSAPSRVLSGAAGGGGTLDGLIASNPAAFLGEDAAGSFGGQLPFLLKLLAAASPLSIQCHPSLEQAREGFARENIGGIPLDARERNYKDANHKPEIILALTPFSALRGLRPLDETIRFFSAFPAPDLRAAAAALEKNQSGEGIKAFLGTLLSASRDTARAWIQALQSPQGGAGVRQAPGFRAFLRLAGSYPEDSGCLAPFYLNLVDLAPGEALFLGPGELHAYLGGLGVELMANSDNVLRAGLTPKHIDVRELLALVSCKAAKAEILRPRAVRHGGFTESEYPCRAREFALSLITAEGEADIQTGGPEILFCGGGNAVLETAEGPCALAKGESVFIPASQKAYRLKGSCAIYRARVPSPQEGPPQ
ncbi:MAG: mannose-6-phosphate isomerase, class I [Spirochaetia bacterium]|jgi:mannose-6-phosphate isomerase|nr:mannose-6-phosphate isomerase, class I [Spirochaetia bacterium]